MSKNCWQKSVVATLIIILALDCGWYGHAAYMKHKAKEITKDLMIIATFDGEATTITGDLTISAFHVDVDALILGAFMGGSQYWEEDNDGMILGIGPYEFMLVDGKPVTISVDTNHPVFETARKVTK